jgi:UDP-N-acetylglucosamine:LPS N-acetylglucosamine transferase
LKSYSSARSAGWKPRYCRIGICISKNLDSRLQRGWTMRDIWVNLLFPVRLIVSLIQSYFIIKNFNPDIAIGTEVIPRSASQNCRTAEIPIFLHEQNVFPGATTKMLAGNAKRIYTSFVESQTFWKTRSILVLLCGAR